MCMKGVCADVYMHDGRDGRARVQVSAHECVQVHAGCVCTHVCMYMKGMCADACACTCVIGVHVCRGASVQECVSVCRCVHVPAYHGPRAGWVGAVSSCEPACTPPGIWGHLLKQHGWPVTRAGSRTVQVGSGSLLAEDQECKRGMVTEEKACGLCVLSSFACVCHRAFRQGAGTVCDSDSYCI